MKRQIIKIAKPEEFTEITAYVSDEFPGIAIHNMDFNDNVWIATHLDSGMAIFSKFTLRRDAMQFAVLVSGVIDYSMPDALERYKADHELRAKIREIAGQFKEKRNPCVEM